LKGFGLVACREGFMSRREEPGIAPFDQSLARIGEARPHRQALA
jgi:hypothetical protein